MLVTKALIWATFKNPHPIPPEENVEPKEIKVISDIYLTGPML